MRFKSRGRRFHCGLVLVAGAAAIGWFMPAAAAASTPPGFPPFARDEFSPAGLGPREPELQIDYPGGATTRSIAKGSAVVSVLVDADGKALDFLVMGYTDKAFGSALLARAEHLTYQAAKLKGTPVPARFNLGYSFESQRVAMTPMEASLQKGDGLHAPGLAYSAVVEGKLDRPLDFLKVALPPLPADFKPVDDKPVKVYVTFYIDEEGRVRVPTVESAASAKLIPGAIAAVREWAFKPPTAGGKPALVFTGRPVRFIPRDAAK